MNIFQNRLDEVGKCKKYIPKIADDYIREKLDKWSSFFYLTKM